MLTAQAHIQTEHPSRYLAQLCRHANSINHKNLRLHSSKAQVRLSCSTPNGPAMTGPSP